MPKPTPEELEILRSSVEAGAFTPAAVSSPTPSATPTGPGAQLGYGMGDTYRALAGLPGMLAGGAPPSPTGEPPGTFGERAARTIGQYAAPIPVPPLVGGLAVRGVTAAAARISPRLSRFVSALTRPAAATWTEAAARSAAGSAYGLPAGVGAFAARELAGEGEPTLLEIPAALLASGPAGMVAAGVRSRLPKRQAAHLIGRVVPPSERAETLAKLERAEEVTARLPGARRTTAQVTGSEGIQQLERQAAAQPTASSNAFHVDVERFRADTEQALDQAMAGVAPGGAPQAAVDVLAKRVAAAHTQAERAMESVRAAGGPSSSTADASLLAQPLLEAAALAARNRVTAMYPDVMDAPVSLQPLKDRFAQLRSEQEFSLHRMGRAGQEAARAAAKVKRIDVPHAPGEGIEQDVLDLLASEEAATISLRAAQSLRSELSAGSRDTARAGERVGARMLAQLRDALDQAIDEAGEGLAFDQVARYREATGAFAEIAKVYRDGIAGEAIVGTKFTPAETLREFWQPREKGVDSIQQFHKTVESMASETGQVSADAFRQRMTEFVIRDFMDQAVDENGVVNPTRAATYLKRHREGFRGLPEAQKLLANAVTAQKTLVERFGSGVRRPAGDSEAGAVRLLLGTEPSKMMAAIRGSSQPEAAALKARAALQGDATAERGLRQVLWDDFYRAATAREIASDGVPQALWQPSKALQYLDENRGIMRALGWDSTTLGDMREFLSVGATVLEGARLPPMNPGRESAFERVWFWLRPGSGTIRAGTAGVGITGTPLAGAAVLSAALGAETVQRALSGRAQRYIEEALKDPKKFAEMIRFATKIEKGQKLPVAVGRGLKFAVPGAVGAREARE